MIDIHSPKMSRGLATVSSWMTAANGREFMQAVKDDTLTEEQLSWIDDPLLIPETMLSEMGIVYREVKINKG